MPLPKHRTKRILLILVVAVLVVVAGISVFVGTLPPPLTIHDESIEGTIPGDFPMIFSNDSMSFSFNATTFANQTQGPSSSLALHVQGYAYWIGYPNRAFGELLTQVDATVTGHFASNLRPSQLQVACNGTGVETYVDAWPGEGQGTNVSFDRNQAIGFRDSGVGSVPVTLTGGNGAGEFHDFDFSMPIELNQYRGFQAFLGLRATVTGWMLPPISVGILLQTVYVHNVVTLFPSGENWTVLPGGEVDLEFTPYTSYIFTVKGSLEASGPFTAYIEDLPTYLGLSGSGPWSWTSGAGVTSSSINVTLVSEWGYIAPYPWYLVLDNANGQTSVTVRVAQPITATL